MSVNLVSGQIGTMVVFFIPNDNPSEMIRIHQFEWNAPHLTPIGNNSVSIQNDSSFVKSPCSSSQDKEPSRRSTFFEVCELKLSGNKLKRHNICCYIISLTSYI